MSWKHQLCGGLGLLLGGAAAMAQAPLTPAPMPPGPASATPMPPALVTQAPAPSAGTTQIAPPSTGMGAEAESRPAERSEAAPPAKLGPTPVEDVGFLASVLGLKDQQCSCLSGIRAYGWLEAGYTYSSTGHGQLATETRENHYGDEFLLNEIGFVLEKPLEKGWSWGFNVTYWAGADPALIQPKGGIDDPPGNPRFSEDFRQLYLSAHLPVLTEGGVDVKVGRMGTIIGYNGALAPYRPFYSSDYQWFYSQDGAWTGALTNWHVSDQLDILNGVTEGANTFFTMRSHNSLCYIGQINYWLQPEKQTMVTASLHMGRDAIFAAPGLDGTFDTIVELRVLQNWNEYFTQIIQSNMGWDTNTPVGTGSWYGVYTIGIFHMSSDVDALVRAEWFDDVRGTRTGIDANFEEVTFGINWHPTSYLEFRPEIRGDFASKPAFGTGSVPRDKSQLTVALSALLKF